MKDNLLELLRCPFCGGRLTLHRVQSGPRTAAQDGILCCECCAYPVVEGIPYLRTGAAAETALRLLGDKQHQQALFTLLGLPETQRELFQRLLARDRPATFRECLAVLCPGAEGDYLFHRFSDPTFLCSRLVVRPLASDSPCMTGRVLDVCGGTGHLTRSLCELADDVVLADLSFAKLWLAKRSIAPRCEPVCCDAGEPLPFAPGAFSFVLCSDAFHYVWRRRLFAGEMIRALAENGTIVLPHLHNLHADNISAGMPLPSAAYRRLFDGLQTRVFKESSVLESLLTGQALDLSAGCTDEELAEEAALVLVATRLPDLHRVFETLPENAPRQPLARNPLYVAERNGNGEIWTLRFPSEGYELEYASCRRYLPERVELSEGDLIDLRRRWFSDKLKALAKNHVLLELPESYE
jgi:uncharacterized protein YbaR (Trm112 family)/SAM-dependent methyltransferase